MTKTAGKKGLLSINHDLEIECHTCGHERLQCQGVLKNINEGYLNQCGNGKDTNAMVIEC